MAHKRRPLIRVNYFLSAQERDGFAKLARQRGISAASLVRQVLDAYLGIAQEPVAPVVFKNPPPFVK